MLSLSVSGELVVEIVDEWIVAMLPHTIAEDAGRGGAENHSRRQYWPSSRHQSPTSLGS
jgi:hypothetical protein